MITNVYIDGFNLYFRALHGTGFKWLDIRALSERLFPNDLIQTVNYFTARIIQRPQDPDQGNRQLTYLRALSTLPGVEIHYGAFRPRTKRRPLARPIQGLPRFVEVLDSEEKGTDVNLATQLLVDAFKGHCEQTVVISSDADFATAMRYVKDDIGLRVSIVNPDPTTRPPYSLVDASTYVKNLRASHLRASQLPTTLSDSTGLITKPSSW